MRRRLRRWWRMYVVGDGCALCDAQVALREVGGPWYCRDCAEDQGFPEPERDDR